MPCTDQTHRPFTRRRLSVLALSFAAAGSRAKAQVGADERAGRVRAAITTIESTNGGRLGVAVLDTGSGRDVTWRADERFPMCSTYKMTLGAAVLAWADRGEIDLMQTVPFGPADLLEYAPITRRAVREASALTVEALCIAAVRWSDNTAANRLLDLLGGPAGWTAYVRALGDGVSRLDRTEPTLNEAVPGDPRDTTTPAAMLHDVRTLLLGDALSPRSRARLEAMMTDDVLTNDLLRAGLPARWQVADRSGAGGRGTRNDVGIIRPPGGAPILVSVFYTGSERSMTAQNAVIADVARAVVGMVQ